MNIAKSILSALGLILLIALTGVYFLPDNYTVSHSVTINCPSPVVYAHVSDYSQWQKWSPWIKLDPAAQVRYEGNPSTPGHKMSWQGAKTGQGTLTIISTALNGSINGELNIKKPFPAVGRDNWKFEETGKTTKVTWTSSGPLKFPFGRLMGTSLDEMLGHQEQQGLEKLKQVCEEAYAAKMLTAADSTPK